MSQLTEHKCDSFTLICGGGEGGIQSRVPILPNSYKWLSGRETYNMKI